MTIWELQKRLHVIILYNYLIIVIFAFVYKNVFDVIIVYVKDATF